MIAYANKLQNFKNIDLNEIKSDDVNKLIFALNDISDICYFKKLDWHKKQTKLSISDIKSFIAKKYYDFDPAKLESADYLIIAGDLGLDNTYDLILNDISEKTSGKFKKILHIAGNHDHWWINDSKQNIKKPDHVNLSHDQFELIDGDYLFIGTTLWTPLSERDIYVIGRYMNDYKYTPGNFSPYMSNEQYRLQSIWLKELIAENKDKKIIVFTHHQPFEELTIDDYKHNGKNWDGIDVNAAYVVLDHSLDDINKYGNIKLWCCGHTHQCFDGIINNVHVVRNPIGYGDLYGYLIPENTSGTWYNKIIEV